MNDTSPSLTGLPVNQRIAKDLTRRSDGPVDLGAPRSGLRTRAHHADEAIDRPVRVAHDHDRSITPVRTGTGAAQ